jgi:hypothetical protein
MYLACTWLAPPKHMACTSHVPGFGRLCPAILHSSFCLQPSLGGGFGWLCPAFLHSSFCILPSFTGVHHKHPEYNSPPAPPSGWSGGTLDKPWTCPGTIEPPQTPVFDQPSLSRRRSCGISAAERFRCGADLWSAGARSLRLAVPCSAIPDLWVALPTRCAFIILHSAFTSEWPWGGFSVALGSHWGRSGVALGWLWGGFGVALGCLSVGYQHALGWL